MNREQYIPLKCKEYPINFDLINEIDSQYYQVKRTKATVKTTIMVKKEDYQCLEEQLLAEQCKNKELEQECNSLKMYKYWGEILNNANTVLDELQEYLIKNQMFDFAQKLMFTRKENIGLQAKNKKLIEALESVQNNLDNILLPDYEEDYGNYNTFYQQTSAVITQALNEVNKWV